MRLPMLAYEWTDPAAGQAVAFNPVPNPATNGTWDNSAVDRMLDTARHDDFAAAGSHLCWKFKIVSCGIEIVRVLCQFVHVSQMLWDGRTVDRPLLYRRISTPTAMLLAEINAHLRAYERRQEPADPLPGVTAAAHYSITPMEPDDPAARRLMPLVMKQDGRWRFKLPAAQGV